MKVNNKQPMSRQQQKSFETKNRIFLAAKKILQKAFILYRRTADNRSGLPGTSKGCSRGKKGNHPRLFELRRVL